MKKLLLVLGVLVSSVAMAEGNVVEGRLGYRFTGGKVQDKVQLSVEYRREVKPNVEVGLGLDVKKSGTLYSDKSDENNYTEVKSSGLPVYTVAQYNFDTNSDIVPYVKGKLGLVLGAKVTGRTVKAGKEISKESISANVIYAGVGAGVNYKNFVADLSYNHPVRALTLSVGYGFKF